MPLQSPRFVDVSGWKPREEESRTLVVTTITEIGGVPYNHTFYPRWEDDGGEPRFAAEVSGGVIFGQALENVERYNEHHPTQVLPPVVWDFEPLPAGAFTVGAQLCLLQGAHLGLPPEMFQVELGEIIWLTEVDPTRMPPPGRQRKGKRRKPTDILLRIVRLEDPLPGEEGPADEP